MTLDRISPKSITGTMISHSMGESVLPRNVSPSEEEMPERRGDEVCLASLPVKKAPVSQEAPQGAPREKTPAPVQHEEPPTIIATIEEPPDKDSAGCARGEGAVKCFQDLPGGHTMKAADLDILLQEGEGAMLEYKEGFSSSFPRGLVAFANTAGGRILLGVRDDSNIKGIADTNELRARIQDIARNCVTGHTSAR